MKEPRKFPKVLTGVMLFLMGKCHKPFLYDIVLTIVVSISPLLRRWRHVLPDLRLRRADRRHREP